MLGVGNGSGIYVVAVVAVAGVCERGGISYIDPRRESSIPMSMAVAGADIVVVAEMGEVVGFREWEWE